MSCMLHLELLIGIYSMQSYLHTNIYIICYFLENSRKQTAGDSLLTHSFNHLFLRVTLQADLRLTSFLALFSKHV